jgi:hypothetical protein
VIDQRKAYTRTQSIKRKMTIEQFIASFEGYSNIPFFKNHIVTLKKICSFYETQFENYPDLMYLIIQLNRKYSWDSNKPVIYKLVYGGLIKITSSLILYTGILPPLVYENNNNQDEINFYNRFIQSLDKTYLDGNIKLQVDFSCLTPNIYLQTMIRQKYAEYKILKQEKKNIKHALLKKEEEIEEYVKMSSLEKERQILQNALESKLQNLEKFDDSFRSSDVRFCDDDGYFD